MPPKKRDDSVVDALREFHPTLTQHWYDQYLKAYRNRESAAPAKGIRWDLPLRDFWELVLKAGGRCQVTRQPFDRERKAANGKRPFLPSLDRVDSIGGYTKDNVELTTIMVNLALNEHGRNAFFED
jgi:hypothetical protein